jgi:hypothetical protein
MLGTCPKCGSETDQWVEYTELKDTIVEACRSCDWERRESIDN